MYLDSFLYTNAGGRNYNEDAVGSAPLHDGGIFVVADGLGGHSQSEQASALVVSALTGGEMPGEDADGGLWLRERIAAANEQILALQAETHTTMKSTVAVLMVQGRQARWAHVGDSRVYYIHDRELSAITEDHSVAYKKYKAGEITRGQIGTDEDQSSLLRALGNPDRNRPDLGSSQEPLAPGDGFLLCSDGLWEYVRDGEILVDFLKSGSAQEWAEHLLLRVISRVQGDHDNLSLITILAR